MCQPHVTALVLGLCTLVGCGRKTEQIIDAVPAYYRGTYCLLQPVKSEGNYPGSVMIRVGAHEFVTYYYEDSKNDGVRHPAASIIFRTVDGKRSLASVELVESKYNSLAIYLQETEAGWADIPMPTVVTIANGRRADYSEGKYIKSQSQSCDCIHRYW